jgi:hypothetical protein
VREEDDPVISNELMEVNGALGGVGLEVGGNAAETETGIDPSMSATGFPRKRAWNEHHGLSLARLMTKEGKWPRPERIGKTYGAERSSAILSL